MRLLSPTPIHRFATTLALFLMAGTLSFAADPTVYVGPTYQSQVDVFNTSSGAETSSFDAGVKGSALVLAPDGVHAYLASPTTNSILVVDPATHKTTSKLPGGDAPVAIALSSDGSVLYIADNTTPTLTEVNTSTGQEIASIPLQIRQLYAIAVEPDNSKVYVTGSNGLNVINTETNSVSTVKLSDPTGLAVSPSGATLYVASGAYPAYLSVINTATNAVTAQIPLSGPSFGEAISPDGNTLYVTSYGGIITISTATNTVTGSIGTGQFNIVTVSADGTEGCGVVYQSPMAIQFNLQTGAAVHTFNISGPGTACAISSNGATFYTLTSSASVVDTVDTTTNKKTSIIQNDPGSFVLTASSRGNVVVGASSTGLSVIQTSTHKVSNTISFPNATGNLPSVAVNSKGTTAYVTLYNTDTIGYIDLSTGATTQSVALPSTSGNIFLALSPNGQTLYALASNDSLGIGLELCSIDIASASVNACAITSTQAYNTEVLTRAIAVSPDGTKVFAFSSFSTIGEYDAQSLSLIANIEVTPYTLDSFVVSGAQNAIYASAYNINPGSVYRIDLGTLQVTASQSYTFSVLDVAVTPDGSEVYIAGTPNTFRALNGTTLATIAGTPVVQQTHSVVVAPR